MAFLLLINPRPATLSLIIIQSVPLTPPGRVVRFNQNFRLQCTVELRSMLIRSKERTDGGDLLS